MSNSGEGQTKIATFARALVVLGTVIVLAGVFLGTLFMIKGCGHGHHSPHNELWMVLTLFGIGGPGLVLLLIGLLVAYWANLCQLGAARILTALVVLAVAGGIFGLGGLRAYHFLESPGFCGKICHTVMTPESDTFEVSPHASITCAACHVGPGIPAFIKAKIAGTKELLHLMTGNFERPLQVPVHNMRPAGETCGACHGPEKVHTPTLNQWTTYRTDDSNTPWTVAMIMDMSEREAGPHWCVEGQRTIEYVSVDDKRLVIPWIRVTDKDGKETIYRTNEEDEALSEEQMKALHVRRFDCNDCHNRIGHDFLSPNEAIDAAISAGDLDRAIPAIKLNAASLLAEEYESTEVAMKAIEDGIRGEYGDREDVDDVVKAVQDAYAANFFPEMKVTWKHYPNHLKHTHNSGCFRCHDGKHVSDDGSKITRDCNACHRIIAQGPGDKLNVGSLSGIEYQHPEDIDKEWKTEKCSSCHEGTPM